MWKEILPTRKDYRNQPTDSDGRVIRTTFLTSANGKLALAKSYRKTQVQKTVRRMNYQVNLRGLYYTE